MGGTEYPEGNVIIDVKLFTSPLLLHLISLNNNNQDKLIN